MLPRAEIVGLVLLLTVLAAMVYFGTRGSISPVITGYKPVPSTTKLLVIKTSTDADAVTTVTNVSDPSHTLHLARKAWGGLEAKPEDLAATLPDGRKVWQIKDEVTYGLFEPGLDIGGFAGYARWSNGATPSRSAFQTGLRVSPLRSLYGTVSFPDFLFTSQAIGYGISLYSPAAWAGDTLSHIGLGYGRLYAFHGGQANLAYLSFSFTY